MSDLERVIWDQRLTGKQKAVMHLIASGLYRKEIASRLGVCKKTVDQHITKIKQRLGIGNDRSLSVMLTHWALELGIVDSLVQSKENHLCHTNR